MSKLTVKALGFPCGNRVMGRLRGSPWGAVVLRRALGVMLMALSLVLMPGVGRAQLNRYYYYQRTQKHIARGAFIQGIGEINVFLDFQPDDEISLYLRALCKYNLADYSGARKDLTHLLNLRPFMAEALLLRSAVRNQLGPLDSALSDVELALELRPNDVQIRYMRGVTHFLMENYPAALDDFSATLLASPDRLEVRVNRGLTYLRHGDTARAEKDFTSAARAHPYSVMPLLHLAQLRYSQGDHGGVLEYATRVLSIDAKNSPGYLMKALAEHGMGRLDSALASISRSIELAPRNSLALYNRGLMYVDRKDWKAALRDFSEAQRISPSNLYVVFNYAMMQRELKRPWRAIEGLNRAIALYPHFALAYAARAELNMEVGEKEQARRDYDSAQHLRDLYRKGKIANAGDSLSESFQRLIAFDMDFTPRDVLMLPLAEGDPNELLPLAQIALGRVQQYREWLPVQRADSICGGPFFSLVVPKEDTAQYLDVNELPPLRNGQAVLLFEALENLRRFEYDTALRKVESLLPSSHFGQLAELTRAVALVGKTRYTSQIEQPSLPLVNITGRRAATPTLNYAEPIAILQRLHSLYPNAYLAYNLGVVHYLSRELEQAEANFTEALTLEPRFAQALYNRGLVRMLRGDAHAACDDWSRAGELGLDVAYRAISTHCNR